MEYIKRTTTDAHLELCVGVSVCVRLYVCVCVCKERKRKGFDRHPTKES